MSKLLRIHADNAYWRLLILSVFLVVICVASAAQAAGAEVLATVDGRPITREEVIRAVPQAARDSGLLAQSLQRYINTLLIYNDAIRQHLVREAKEKHVPPAELQQWLIGKAEDKWIAAHPITAQDVAVQYHQFVSSLPPKEWRLREIVVTTREEASRIIADIKRGENFSVLAASQSQGPNAELGGELGWVDPGKIDASIRQYMTSMKPLQIVGPVVVPQGLAIVQLLGLRDTPKPGLSKLKSSLEARLRTQRIEAYAAELREHAHIVYPAHHAGT